MTPQEEEYRLIPLTQGQWAIISLIDYDELMRWKWYARWNPGMKSFYACRKINVNGKTVTVQMHRQVLGLVQDDPRKGDHKNTNTLDNRRSNLRIATHSQNMHNHRKRADNKSGYIGVYLFKRIGLYRAFIVLNGKQIHLGYFKTPEEGAEARRIAALKYHGEFARTK
jgi:hypothetical protein